MKKNEEYPYPECKACKDLGDCPHPELNNENLLSEPMIPDICPKPISVMKATLKKHKITHKLIREN
jgi:hypothetical protein